MEDKKFTVTNQSTEAAKVEEGDKGCRRSGTGNGSRAKIADVQHLRPPPRLNHRVSKNVPKEDKTPEYYEYRRKNTEAVRKFREKKRQLDECRVKIIMAQRQLIEQLQQREASLKHDNRIYRNIIRVLSRQRGQRVQVPQLSSKETRKGRGSK